MEKHFNGHAKDGGIYRIINKINQKIYIGSTNNFKKRAYQHIFSLRKNNHYNLFLQNSFNKYGEDAFIFEVFEVINDSLTKIREKEQEHICKYLEKWDQCFNIAKKIIQKQGPWSHAPEETSRKISIANKKRWSDPKYKERVSKAMKKAWTEEVRKEASGRLTGCGNPMYGKTASKETKKKIGSASKKLWKNQKHRNKMKLILSKRTKNQWEDPEIRKKMVSNIKKTKNKPSSKRKQSILTKKQWENPEVRKKMIEAINQEHVKKMQSEASKKMWESQEFRDKMNLILSKQTKKQWEDPKVRKKMIKSLQGINAKTYFFLNPDGEKITIINLRKFCRENKLSYHGMYKVSKGKQSEHKGWTKDFIQPQ